MATKGGRRPGAGRKPNSEKFETQINKAHSIIKKNWEDILMGLIELAKGVTIEETDPVDGQVTVFKKAPDFKAASYLVDRVMGKPTQKQEITGEDGGPIQVESQQFNYDQALSDIAPSDAKT